jgi:hypothetical protein
MLVFSAEQAFPASNGQVQLTVVDKDTGKPIACRMHLLGPKKHSFKPDKVPFWNDHFVVPGQILLKLPVGNYTFLIERGLEYLQQEGHFTIEHFADDSKRIELRRFANMAADGWWSGDLDVRRPLRDIELLMTADDLHVAEVITWRNDKPLSPAPLSKNPLVRFDGNRFYQAMGTAWSLSGTDLLLLNSSTPLKLPNGDYPPILSVLPAAREKGDLWVDAARPYGWDLPMLVAAGQIDSVEVAHGQICRDRTINDEGEGKPRDRKRYPSYKGNAEWSHEVYFRLLECGLRIPPTAGSSSGEAPNPVGYNRVYVHVDETLTYEKWWQQLRAGAVVVTNGPLMLPSVEGQRPGHVFQADAGGKIELEIGLTFSTREPVTYLEIIKDGHVEHEVRFDEYAKSGRLPKLQFDRSGWFLVRAVTDLPRTYRFAMTGPYYVEIGYQKRISKSAAQFFVDWIYERAKQIHLADPKQQKEVLEWHRKARDFWQDLLSRANAE